VVACSIVAAHRCKPGARTIVPGLAWDLDEYRVEAESFLEELSREYYLQGAGHKPDLVLEPIYARHGGLFEADAVERIGEARRAAREEEEQVRLRYLHQFALDGHLGAATRSLEARIADLEASLEVEVGGEEISYRMSPMLQANEADAGRRAELEAARIAALDEHLNPLHLEALEISHGACAELGWPSYLDAYSDVRALDLRALAARLGRFLAETEEGYAPPVERRSDLPRFFRATELDGLFPADGMVPALRRTLAGLGIDLDAQENVTLDTESRPTKSPRAFCATPRVPEEVYLVLPPIGGREDYATLFHEAGHTEHYASTDAGLAFEFRHLGDNSVTESFAFLLEGLTASEGWLENLLGVEGDAEAAIEHARAARLVMLRRYSAKIAYEVELHGPDADLSGMPGRYAELLGAAVGVTYPRETWVSDVDEGFYAACYLRAWALEVDWRGELISRFGQTWFESAEAGEWLRDLWSQGQRRDAAALLEGETGGRIDFGRLASELTSV
jgi:hypothetical protein